ncbi:MAG: hypothetical protein LLG04_06790 [Parachlamydia sp.]|nr:hypothetical protein [Parachlamydia sp.]
MQFRALLLLLLLSVAQGQAEVQKVIVHWRGITCGAVCVAMLTQKFQQTPGVASVTMYPAAQAADLRWSPLVPFNYRMVKFAVQSVGPGIEEIRVKVRGVIQYQNNQFWIISLGDNTPFALLGPTVGQPGGQSQYYSLAYHPLSAELQQALLLGIQQQRVAIIEGQLYLPDSTGLNMLIVGNLQFVQPELHP